MNVYAVVGRGVESMKVYATIGNEAEFESQVLAALNDCSNDEELHMKFCKSYQGAYDIATEWLKDDGYSDIEVTEVAIIPLELDLNDISCVHLKMSTVVTKLHN